jgi:hypothetical protein
MATEIMYVDKYYYKDGSILSHLDDEKVLHRVNGPAVEWFGGKDFYYYIDDIYYTEENFNKYKELIKLIYE